MRLKMFILALVLFPAALAARADGLGTTVTGSLYFYGGLTNYFNPAYGLVPAGYGNATGTTTFAGTSVVIGPVIEFGYNDSDNPYGGNFDTADFTGTTLTITDVDTAGAGPFEMDFTDTAFTSITQLTNASGFTYSFSGDTLKVFYPGTLNLGTYTTTFSYGPPAMVAVTPEPSSFLLLFTGLAGIAWFGRKRFAGMMTSAGDLA